MQTASALLSRRPHRPAPQITLGDAEIALRLGRVHELCGTARHTLALAVAAQTQGPVIWAKGDGVSHTMCPDGMANWINPGNILFVAAKKRDGLLWTLEEALRDGRTPVVIGEFSAPPGLVPVRRLHLAAEAGSGVGFCQPIALLLTPEDGGAPGIETRWSLSPNHTRHAERWTLSRLRARMAPPRDWMMTVAQGRLVPYSDPVPQTHQAQRA